MSNITIFDQSIPSIGYTARSTTYGEEFEMVNKFIDEIIKKKDSLSRKRIDIFIEPQIETGYPDIVIAEYYMSKKFHWCDDRHNLTNNDLKILFEIQKANKLPISKLEELLGFSKQDLNKSLSKLSKSNMINIFNSSECVGSVNIGKYSRINKIIAIEAKVDKWNEAIRQATNNTWFATESYILMNKEKCDESIVQLCKDRGIGIILMNGKIQKKLDSEKRNFPVSYSSLLFNEWIFRKIYQKEEE